MVVAWIVDLIRDGVTDPRQLTTARIAIDKLLFSPEEISRMYQQSLAAVESSKGIPAVKELALRIGRRSYSALRPDHRPTVYDEQAIANDIAMRA